MTLLVFTTTTFFFAQGQSIEFSCKIVGKPAPTVQWHKGDKLIKPSKYFQMSRTADEYTLRISEAFPEDEGDYKCVAYNSAGRVTVAAKLKVTQPDQADSLPTLTPLRDIVVFEGQPAQFKTQISGKVKPTIQWLREGALIPVTPDFQVIVIQQQFCILSTAPGLLFALVFVFV